MSDKVVGGKIKLKLRCLLTAFFLFWNLESSQGTVKFMGPIAKIGIGYSIFLITLLFGAKKWEAKKSMRENVAKLAFFPDSSFWG